MCARCSFCCFLVRGVKIEIWTDFVYLCPTGGGGAAAAMVAADMDEGAGEGWGEDEALVIDEGTCTFYL